MTELSDIAATRLAGIAPYRPGKPPTGPLAGKLSANESALGPGPAVVAAIAGAAQGVGHYPREDSLLSAVATAHGVGAEYVLATNGSDELCHLIATVFLGSGRTAVMGDPCYAIDATATLVSGAEAVRVPLVNGAQDLATMAREAQSANVVWLPSPHNPTGVALLPQDIDAFLGEVPQRCLVVLDLAYADFADDDYQLTVSEVLDRHPHVLIQRTLSKSQSLAGLRVGIALAHPEIINALRTVRLPFSVNALGAAAAEAALTRPAWSEMSVARVREGRSLLEAELDALGVEYLASQANFVLVHLDHDIVREPLARHGISVRNGSDLGIPGWTRITVGWAPTMTSLRRGLREALETHRITDDTTEGAS